MKSVEKKNGSSTLELNIDVFIGAVILATLAGIFKKSSNFNLLVGNIWTLIVLVPEHRTPGTSMFRNTQECPECSGRSGILKSPVSVFFLIFICFDLL